MRLQIHIDNDRYVVAEARGAPILERSNAERADLREPLGRKRNVVDVIGRVVLLAITPVESWCRFASLFLAAQLVISADQAGLA